jgi:sensor domain CHASE-containing protein
VVLNRENDESLVVLFEKRLQLRIESSGVVYQTWLLLADSFVRLGELDFRHVRRNLGEVVFGELGEGRGVFFLDRRHRLFFFEFCRKDEIRVF